MKLTAQIKQRRQALGLQQKDMQLRIGMKQQQYQRIETEGNPRLDTLELVAEGLDAELVLVPKDKLRAVREFLRAGSPEDKAGNQGTRTDEDPWSDILE
ncbi:helix-turn-helix transcriptional regulator [Microbulbifer sp. SAOS-129_SWC]|uniref:helix-turn-helix domain-containing protein n=1 Tax=Microbulbifer sp. SAOS-129_SWC TaxID=3145235 RepID=UPI0032165C41